MRRRESIQELVDAGCYLKRHGSRHDIYANSKTGRVAFVPRHDEIGNSFCVLIRKWLGI